MMDEERNCTTVDQRASDKKSHLPDFILMAIRDFKEACRLSKETSKDLLYVGDGKGEGQEWVRARLCLANARLRDG